MINIPEWLGIAFLGVLGFVLGLGIKRLLLGQDTMIQNHTDMKEQLTRTCGNLEASNARLEAQKNACDERHANNVEEHGNVWSVIEKIRK